MGSDYIDMFLYFNRGAALAYQRTLPSIYHRSWCSIFYKCGKSFIRLEFSYSVIELVVGFLITECDISLPPSTGVRALP